MDTRRLVAFQTGGRETAGSAGIAPALPRFKVRPWWILSWVLIAGLFVHAFQQAPWVQVGALISRLNAGAISVLLLLNLVFLLLVNLRWWLLLRSLGWKISLLALVSYRLTGFGVSYFTPGPLVGGEPLQVHLLHIQHGVPLEDAISGVFLDRLVDALANFTFLLIGCLIVIASGLLESILPSWIWMLALVLFIFPVMHLIALRLGKQPATWLLNRLHGSALLRFRDLLIRAETQIACLIRERPFILATVIGVSLLVWGGVMLEFWLCLRFLGIQAGLDEVISSLTLMRFALLVPVPGGLGALETSQRFAAQMLGWGAAAGLAISMVVRARDSFFALLGLGLGAFSYREFFLPKINKEG